MSIRKYIDARPRAGRHGTHTGKGTGKGSDFGAHLERINHCVFLGWSSCFSVLVWSSRLYDGRLVMTGKGRQRLVWVLVEF